MTCPSLVIIELVFSPMLFLKNLSNTHTHSATQFETEMKQSLFVSRTSSQSILSSTSTHNLSGGIRNFSQVFCTEKSSQ